MAGNQADYQQLQLEPYLLLLTCRSPILGKATLMLLTVTEAIGALCATLMGSMSSLLLLEVSSFLYVLQMGCCALATAAQPSSSSIATAVFFILLLKLTPRFVVGCAVGG